MPMIRKTLTTLACLCLTACATPVTTLHTSKGETITCGGSRAGALSGGLVGYAINRQMDDDCVAKARLKGAK